MLPGRRLLLLLRSTHLPVQPLEDRGWACFLRVRRDKMSSRQADFTGDAARDAVSSIEKCLTQRSIDMDTGKAEGAVEEIAGKVQGAAGALVGGLAGKAQQLRAAAASAVRETTAANTLMTLAVVAAGSFVAGAIWRTGGPGRTDRKATLARAVVPGPITPIHASARALGRGIDGHVTNR